MPRPQCAGARPMSQWRALSVTMAMRVFQLPWCQIYGGGEKRSPNAIAVMRGTLPLGESPALLSEGPQHPLFLPCRWILEVQRSVWPPMGWKHIWGCILGRHACRMGKDMP